jgi:hypothetical protein
MDYTNAFIGKTAQPTEKELGTALGSAFSAWNELLDWFSEEQGVNIHEWTSYSPKYGWTLRLKLKKRTIVYLGPGEGRFLVMFILGAKAVAAARTSNLPKAIVKALDEAPRYPEGTGLRLVVAKSKDLPAIHKIALVKLAN